MPEMPAVKRGTDPAGNRPGERLPLHCHLCGRKVGDYPRHRLADAAHEHIDRTHPTQETTA